jgi:hypothetical protein
MILSPASEISRKAPRTKAMKPDIPHLGLKGLGACKPDEKCDRLYDCKPFYRKPRTSQRKNTKTEFRVDDPYLNLLWATTDASLGANTEQNDTLSGFMALSTRQKIQVTATGKRDSDQ